MFPLLIVFLFGICFMVIMALGKIIVNKSVLYSYGNSKKNVISIAFDNTLPDELIQVIISRLERNKMDVRCSYNDLNAILNQFDIHAIDIAIVSDASLPVSNQETIDISSRRLKEPCTCTLIWDSLVHESMLTAFKETIQGK